jgi:hypothetical protein
VVNPEKCIFCGECKKEAEQLDMQHLKNFLRIGKDLCLLREEKRSIHFQG